MFAAFVCVLQGMEGARQALYNGGVRSKKVPVSLFLAPREGFQPELSRTLLPIDFAVPSVGLGLALIA